MKVALTWKFSAWSLTENIFQKCLNSKLQIKKLKLIYREKTAIYDYYDLLTSITDLIFNVKLCHPKISFAKFELEPLLQSVTNILNKRRHQIHARQNWIFFKKNYYIYNIVYLLKKEWNQKIAPSKITFKIIVHIVIFLLKYCIYMYIVTWQFFVSHGYI